MSRPLFNKKVLELEELFDKWKDSPEQLRILDAELEHRKKPKAKELKKSVQARLECLQTSDTPKTQRTLFDEVEASVEPLNPDIPSTNRLRTTRSRQNPIVDRFAAPDEFTWIQPRGTHPRPSTYRPKLKNEVQLNFEADAARVTRYRVALKALIDEMRKSRVGQQQFPLENGRRTAIDAGGFSYQFEFNEEANVFQGARVEIGIGGRSVTGHLTAIPLGQIVVTLQEDFGDFIRVCVLRIDNTALLQALHDRLEKIEGGEVASFRADFAENVLTNAGEGRQPAAIKEWPWPQEPTADQKRFVEVAIANDISWLWGPPGTGKTQVLSALISMLYEADERVLICSNTNQAVDQVLHKLCRNMQETNDPALEEGRVLRLGKGEATLSKEFGEFIEPDRIAERKSAELVKRKTDVETLLERLGRDVSFVEDVLRRFSELDAARKAVEDVAQRASSDRESMRRSENGLAEAKRRHATIEQELNNWQHAGRIRRIFMRNESAIRRELIAQQSRVTSESSVFDDARQKLADTESRHQHAIANARKRETSVAGKDREQCEKIVADCESKRQPLRDELAEIAKQLENIRNAVISNGRIVGATVTRTFLRPEEFSSFQSIIIDEASMMLLPAVFQLAGLATTRFVIAGDFQQLPPIVQTRQQAIHDVLANDVFTEAGITLKTAGTTRGLVMLHDQFRMDSSIAKLVSETFYKGELRTSPKRHPNQFSEPEPLTDRLTLIDTSQIWPFTTRNAFKSRLNLMHALAIRNLILHLQENGRLCEPDGKGRVGVCTPFAAQAALLREIFKSHNIEPATLRASTVHGFQGDERELMILDLVDSVGEQHAGIFLQADDLTDVGAKLINVALSRAKEGLVIVGNLTFLDQKLPGKAILRGLLHDVQEMGNVIDVRDVLALRPVFDDLRQFSNPPELDPESLRSGIFKGPDFVRLSNFDMGNAKSSIVVFSGFITPNRVGQLGDLFRRKLADGVRIRCITRPPNHRRNGSIPEELGREALNALEGLGVAIDLRNDIHEKVVMIDDRITWIGSLNPLSHTLRTSEIMVRADDLGFSRHTATILSVMRRPSDDIQSGSFADAENPRCEECGDWTVFKNGKYGPYFECVKGKNGCGWKQNLDKARRNRRR